MKWKDISKERPPHGELIWVWDNERREKFVIRYFGSEEIWKQTKDASVCPLWAPINIEE